MADASGLMAAASASQAISTAGNAYNQSQAQIAQGNYQRTIAEINAKNAQQAADAAIARGDKAAAAERAKTNEVIAAQKAAAVAGGQDVGTGTIADIQKETATIGTANEMTVKVNAWREAMGYKSQAINLQAQGVQQQTAAMNTARNTMITGGIESAGYGLRSAYYAKGGK